MAFTAAVMINIVVVAQKKYTDRLGLLAVLPLVFLLLTSLYLFVLPYATKWRSGDAPTEPAARPHSATRPFVDTRLFGRALASAWTITTSIRTLWNNKSRWNTQRIPEECLVATQRHSERHSCSLFSG
jgi:hypothetical protein